MSLACSRCRGFFNLFSRRKRNSQRSPLVRGSGNGYRVRSLPIRTKTASPLTARFGSLRRQIAAAGFSFGFCDFAGGPLNRGCAGNIVAAILIQVRSTAGNCGAVIENPAPSLDLIDAAIGLISWARRQRGGISRGSGPEPPWRAWSARPWGTGKALSRCPTLASSGEMAITGSTDPVADPFPGSHGRCGTLVAVARSSSPWTSRTFPFGPSRSYPRRRRAPRWRPFHLGIH